MSSAKNLAEMITQVIGQTLDKIPLYREGVSDEESVLRFQEDPIGFHLRAFRALSIRRSSWLRPIRNG
jgi:hypothetical protein